MPRIRKTTTEPKAAAPKALKTVTIQGVPYLMNDSYELFAWVQDAKSSDPLVKIGTTDEKKTTVTLESGWEAKMAQFLSTYRASLKEMTTEALKRAQELQKAT